MKTVLGLPGTYVPGSDITLKVGEIRGVKSEGMMCSTRELGLGDDHEGIIDLPEDAPIGQSYAVYAGLDDPIIEISVTPNRGDALSVRGVARDLAAAGIGTLKPFAPTPIAATFDSPLQWAIEPNTSCRWALGRVVRGVKNGPSPKWLQDRLTSIGLRPINALVDMTNFFTIDLGRPLHVFDADKITGDTLAFRPGAGETFRALNGKDYTARLEDTVIADNAGVQSLAGVIGGEATGSDNATTAVFIECAWFDPVAVALSGRHHGVSSDARARFERGIDPALMPAALDAATAMVIELCGGTASTVAEAGHEPNWRRTATLRFAQLANFGGLDVPAGETQARLERLGFTLSNLTETDITVNVPSWRNDIAANSPLEPYAQLTNLEAVTEGARMMEPEADLIEEVLRLGGLDAVPPVSMPPVSMPPLVQGGGTVPPATLTPAQSAATSPAAPSPPPGWPNASPSASSPAKPPPSSAPRRTPCISATPSRRTSTRCGPPPSPPSRWPPPATRPAASMTSPSSRSDRASSAASKPNSPCAPPACAPAPRRATGPAAMALSALDAKADALAVLQALGVPMEALTVTADAPEFYHPGQSGQIRQGPKTILATFGALHPHVLSTIDLAGPAIAFEIHLDAIAEPKRRKKSLPDLPAFQPVHRDFSFVVEAGTAAETLLRAARGAERTLIAGVTLFDVYPMGDGKKALGIEVILQPRERTLTDAEIDATSSKIIAAVAKATGGILR